MSDQRVMQGLVDYTGTTNQNGIVVEQMASRNPLRWFVRCTRCSSNWIADHRQIEYLACRNSQCGKDSLEPSRTLAQTGQAITAVRSRDSQSAREYQREHAEPERHWAEPIFENADPASIRRYLDYQETHVRT